MKIVHWQLLSYKTVFTWGGGGGGGGGGGDHHKTLTYEGFAKNSQMVITGIINTHMAFYVGQKQTLKIF